MQQQESPKKLVTCQNIHNQTQNFVILLNQEIGRGYFGNVMKAYEQANPFELLAVKVLPYNGDEQQKQTINKEIDILRSLKEHPNLVRVLPEKCWSEHNFYIFMEYCNQGTLQQKINEKFVKGESFTEPQIFQTFFEVLNGYKVLWEKKILHQDLKPENILIKDGVHKITDFGFSILYQGVKLKKRQGTLEYMPLEKLIKANYYANTKSDVYSLGVIFFKMITGRHPYAFHQYENEQDFIDQLKLANLRPPISAKSRMSLAMLHLFDLIIRMVTKSESERVNFDEIYSFIKEESMFLSFAENSQSTNKILETQQVRIHQQISSINLKFVQHSTALAIPFSILQNESQQLEYEKLLKTKNVQMSEKRKIEVKQKIEKYLCSMHLIVYFFDRLARRLTVQKMRKQFQELQDDLSPSQLSIPSKVIIYLTYFSLKLTKQTLSECRNPSSSSKIYQWSPQQWSSYKQTQPNMSYLMQNDQKYLQMQKNEISLLTPQSKVKSIHKIIDQSKSPLLTFMQEGVRPALFQLLKLRSDCMIDLNNKHELTTINYIMTALEVVDSFREIQENWEELERYFREIETLEIDKLRFKVHHGLRNYRLNGSYIEGDWEE